MFHKVDRFFLVILKHSFFRFFPRKQFNFVFLNLYQIENKIIQIPPVETQSNSENKIPEWVKTNAGWWADGAIDDDSFVQGIQFLIKEGIMSVS